MRKHDWKLMANYFKKFKKKCQITIQYQNTKNKHR